MLKRIITITLLLFSAWIVLAQTTGPFTMAGDSVTPAISHTVPSRDNRDYPFGEQYTDPGAAIYYEGQFHMFRNGFRGWPAAVWIHHMVSDDGINWQQPSDQPVMLTSDVSFAQTAALASSVIVEDDGTWVLYFYTWNGTSGGVSNGAIGRATANDPQGPWTVDAEPVLLRGERGSWDRAGVGAPQVIRNEDSYLMYYEGFSLRGERNVGLAMSEDGIHWTKYEANPILQPELNWEGNRLHQPRVIALDGSWLMVYRTQDSTVNGSMRLGLAQSEDGIHWTRLEDQPFFAPDMLPNQIAFWYTALTKDEDTAYLYVELSPGNNTTDIFAFTAPLDDLGEQ